MRNKLCAVRDHAEHGEQGATCNLCYDMAIRQQMMQRQAEQKVEHQKCLSSLYEKKAA